MPQSSKSRPRLSILVTVLAFATAVALLTGGAITAANYFQTRQAASRVAAATLDRIVRRSSEQLSSFFGSANLLVDLFASNPRITGGGKEIDYVLPSIIRGLRRTPHVTGIYAGYENGDFWEIFSFSDQDDAFVARLKGPVGARNALQTITVGADGVRRESWRFFDTELREMSSRPNVEPTYDPRVRGWYKQARSQPRNIVRTPPYLFANAARSGLTIAESFDASSSGVIAADVTLDSLSTFLGTVQPSPQHRVLVFDQDGALIASPNPEKTPSLQPTKILDVKDPVVQEIAAHFAESGPFSVESFNISGKDFLASVVRLEEPDLQTGGDYILNAAPRSDFEGTLAGGAKRSIVSGLLVILLVSPAVLYIARFVSKPLDQLSDNAKLIQAILDTIPNPVFYKDAESMYLGCNEAFETSFATKRAEIVGKRLLDMEHMPEQDREAHQAEHEEIIRDGGSILREMAVVFADGRSHQTLYHVTGFRNGDGTPGGLVGTLVDITELKDAERVMAEAKEIAEAATKAKGEFLASMSHEIRTPLNGVTGMADLLAQSELNDDQRHMLQTIRESSNALMRVINDILDFSKIEAGKLTIEQTPMSVADALEGVATTLTPGARAKGIMIHTFVDPTIPVAVQGDAVRLRQILFNLTGNAVKFSNKRDVTVRAMNLGQDGAGCRLRFEIIDSGIGISEENQGKLFQAFSQAEASTTRRFGGTGLGLAICKRLADLMDGVIGVSSRLGEGSTFFVELPFGEAPNPRSREAQRDLGGLKVLVVGSPSQREQTIGVYLAHWGAQYTLARDEAAAVDLCARATRNQAPFDSVVIDLGLDLGRQQNFIAQFQKVHDTTRTRLIVLQDYGSRGARIQGRDIVTVDANPLVRHRLVSAVAVAAGRASPDVRQEEGETIAAAVKPPTVEEARAGGQLILLVEDNPTNQDVIRRQLQKLGYACEIANNGVEALKALRADRYALILTDCHMPEMDGYEFTANVRTDEQGSDRRMPIIAITANALQGEAERCLAAGMDDYLSKPVTMKALRDAVRKWMPNAVSAPTPDADTQVVAAAPATHHDKSPVDERTIKDMFGEDEATFKEILGSFVEPSAGIIQVISMAVLARDAEEVRHAAHQLKSSARTIGAHELADACVALEAAGKIADWQAIDSLTPAAKMHMTQVLEYIQRL